MNRGWGVFAIILAAVGGMAGAPAVAAAANTCAPSRKAITLDFVTKAQEPIYNNRLTVSGIRNLLATRGQPVSGPHEKALGVTYVETVFSLQGAVNIKPTGRGFCVYVDRVDVDFGWDRMEVYVASEYKPGSCEYRTVLDHENQHVSINQSVLRETAPRVRATMEGILRDQQPIYIASATGGADRALTAIQNRMNGVLDNFQQAMSTRNGGIDTASNYSAIGEMCSDWDGAQKSPPKKRP